MASNTSPGIGLSATSKDGTTWALDLDSGQWQLSKDNHTLKGAVTLPMRR